jgi:predicted dehydrogenase
MPEPPTTLRAVLIGAGKAGRLFSDASVQLPEVQICAVVSKEGENAINLAALHDAIALDRAADWTVLKPDIVFIATPHDQHVSQIVRALQAGAHVICDKPLVLNRRDWQRISQVAAVTGGRVFCGFTQRCNDDMDNCRKYLLAEHENVQQVQCFQSLQRDRGYYDSWKGSKEHCGGGVGINQAIHAIDLALFLTNFELRLVDARGIDSRSLGVEDYLSAAFRTNTDRVLHLTSTTNASIEERQIIRIDLIDRTLLVVGSERPSWSVVTDDIEGEIARLSNLPDEYGPGHAELIRDVIESLLDQKPTQYRTDLEGTRATHTAIFDIYEKMTVY